MDDLFRPDQPRESAFGGRPRRGSEPDSDALAGTELMSPPRGEDRERDPGRGGAEPPSGGDGGSGGGDGDGDSGGARRPSALSRFGPTFVVLLMTIGTLVLVGVLAVSAKAGATKLASASTNATATPTITASATSTSSSTSTDALPSDSGSGTRIVYSIAEKRLWIVSGSTVEMTFETVPGTVNPSTGTYAVTNKENSVTGSDGTPVEYVVLFDEADVDGTATAFGFDTVAGITGMPSAPTGHTGGIRLAPSDAEAVWQFTSVGTKVVVVA
jgi:hypothetical protein